MSTADNVIRELEKFKLKKERDGQYRCNSPFRNGSDSMGFTVTIDDGEHGAYRDHVSEEQGSLYDLAERLGITIERQEPEKRHAATNTKRIYEGLDDYAQAHGLTGEALQAARWQVVEYYGRSALKFPTKTGNRYRFIDGQKPRFMHDKGYQKCWYGLNMAFFERVKAGQPVVICNGEISTIAGQHHGLAALCVTSGESVIPQTLLDELLFELGDLRPPVIVALDCDKTGQTTALQMAAQFRERGIKARPVDLGFTTGGDLADFCAMYKANAATVLDLQPLLKPEILADAEARWQIYHISQLDKLPKVSWVIDGIIPSGISVIYGASGTWKSFLGVQYAMDIAMDGGAVLYIAGEGVSGYRQRLEAWQTHHKKTPDNFYLSAGTPNLMDKDDVRLFVNQIGSLDLTALFVDTLAMAMIGGDENSSRDMGQVISVCRDLLDLVDAVIIVHHTSKDGMYERGSSSLRGACDGMIKLNRLDDDLVRVENTKSKDSEPFDDIVYSSIQIDTEYGESLVLVPEEQIVRTESDPLTRTQRRVLDVYSLDIYRDSGCSFSDVAELSGVTRGTVAGAATRLAKRGLLEKSGSGSYKATAAGLAALGLTDSGDSPDSGDSGDSGDSPDSPDSPDSKTDSQKNTRISESANQLALLDDEPEQKHHSYYDNL